MTQYASDYQEESFNREQKGDLFNYGRHKKDEQKRSQNFVEKLRVEGVQPIDTYSTILAPDAEKPKQVIIPVSKTIDHQSLRKTRWKKKLKPSKNKTYKMLKMKAKIHLHKEQLSRPKIVGLRIIRRADGSPVHGIEIPAAQINRYPPRSKEFDPKPSVSYGVYVIEINRNPKHLYIGQSHFTPETRLFHHNSGSIRLNAAKVFRRGIKGNLRPELYSHLPRVNSEDQSKAQQSLLVAQLTELGYKVHFGN